MSKLLKRPLSAAEKNQASAWLIKCAEDSARYNAGSTGVKSLA